MALSQPLAYTAQALVTILASLAIAFYNSWRLTLVILAAFPVILPLIALLSSKTQPHLERQKAHLESASKTASCAVVSIDTVKAFNGQDQEHSAFINDVVQAGGAYRGFARIFAMQNAFVRFIGFVIFVQGFWYGGQLVRKSDGDGAAEVMTTFWCCLTATQSLELIMPQMGLLEKGRAAGAALNSLLGKPKRKHNAVGRYGGQMPVQHPEFCFGYIRIEDVSYLTGLKNLAGLTPDSYHLRILHDRLKMY
jgi:ATP-binding cassette subfamily B (MDR/TAP) protein 1